MRSSQYFYIIITTVSPLVDSIPQNWFSKCNVNHFKCVERNDLFRGINLYVVFLIFPFIKSVCDPQFTSSFIIKPKCLVSIFLPIFIKHDHWSTLQSDLCRVIVFSRIELRFWDPSDEGTNEFRSVTYINNVFSSNYIFILSNRISACLGFSYQLFPSNTISVSST